MFQPERIAVDDGGEAFDHAVVEHPVDAALHRRRGQIHLLTDLGEGGPRMLGQLGEDALVGVIQAVHHHPLVLLRNKSLYMSTLAQ